MILFQKQIPRPGERLFCGLRFPLTLMLAVWLGIAAAIVARLL